MKYMSTSVLHDVLSEGQVEGYDGLTIGTYQANMVNKASIRTSVPYHKTGRRRYTLSPCTCALSLEPSLLPRTE